MSSDCKAGTFNLFLFQIASKKLWSFELCANVTPWALPWQIVGLSWNSMYLGFAWRWYSLPSVCCVISDQFSSSHKRFQSVLWAVNWRVSCYQLTPQKSRWAVITVQKSCHAKPADVVTHDFVFFLPNPFWPASGYKVNLFCPTMKLVLFHRLQVRFKAPLA